MLFKTIRRGLHAKYTIIGSGDAGKSITKLLHKSSLANHYDIRIIDPVSEYTYQSGMTLVGGGLAYMHSLKKDKYFLFPIYSDLVKEQVEKVIPEHNTILTADGNKYTYDHLIIAAGTQATPDKIEGLAQALEDPDCPVGSIYLPKYAIKYNKLREQLGVDDPEKEYKAVFTQPLSPIKCGGAPQKILHLSEDSWKQMNLKVDYQFRSGTPKLFPSDHYIPALTSQLDSKNVNHQLNSELIKVDGKRRTATFKNLQSGEQETLDFDILHATPICVPPKFIAESGLAAGNGYVDVDIQTLQHKKFSNIWSLGDAANLPTSKTSSAVNSQIWTLFNNLQGDTKNPQHKYSGYTACPVLVGQDKVMLCEFEYNGKKRNTFWGIDNTKPNFFFFFLKRKVFNFLCLTNLNAYLGLFINRNDK